MVDNIRGMTMPAPTMPSAGAVVDGLCQDFIKFDPEKIMDVSIKLEQQHKKFTQAVGSIKKRSESLMGSWQSDSADIYMVKKKELDTLSVEVAEILLSFSQDLAKASGVYKAGEAGAKQKAEALPTDGVFLV